MKKLVFLICCCCFYTSKAQTPSSLVTPTSKQLQDLKMPILVITGEKSMPWMHCMIEKVVATLPKATHHHLDVGHEMLDTHPELMNQILKDFIVKLNK